MALRFKIAIYMAALTGLLTFFLAIINDISRITTILYRLGITVVLFGGLGYLIGGWIESYLLKLFTEDFHKGQNIDIKDQPDPDFSFREDLANETEDEDALEFKPLTPDEFVNISSKQQ